MRKSFLVGMVLCIAFVGIWIASRPQQQQYQPTIAVGAALGRAGGDTAGFQRVTEPRQFSFPEDHGPHPEYKIEWWYYTGNLESDDGRQWG